MDDSNQIATSLAEWITTVTFSNRDEDEVTSLLIDSIEGWGKHHGWRVYKKATSVFPLPPPYEHRYSYVDVGCARDSEAPLVIEVDRINRRRTIDKLLAEAHAGRIAILVRWGKGGWETPPPPIELVTFHVTYHRGNSTQKRLYSRADSHHRMAPHHTTAWPETCQQDNLFS